MRRLRSIAGGATVCCDLRAGAMAAANPLRGDVERDRECRAVAMKVMGRASSALAEPASELPAWPSAWVGSALASGAAFGRGRRRRSDRAGRLGRGRPRSWCRRALRRARSAVAATSSRWVGSVSGFGPPAGRSAEQGGGPLGSGRHRSRRRLPSRRVPASPGRRLERRPEAPRRGGRLRRRWVVHLRGEEPEAGLGEGDDTQDPGVPIAGECCLMGVAGPIQISGQTGVSSLDVARRRLQQHVVAGQTAGATGDERRATVRRAAGLPRRSARVISRAAWAVTSWPMPSSSRSTRPRSTCR